MNTIVDSYDYARLWSAYWDLKRKVNSLKEENENLKLEVSKLSEYRNDYAKGQN